eukprot:TRINITY_DN10627_c0_g1_i1.p1 TRINITY_DN10627_c0_g1~~TRINITY_DN10627_c0_g1_i1.p1  ORF type:complete len:1057 (-),score=182.30 TRINITY_DN10627_c0_g1_i1:85-3225(-)
MILIFLFLPFVCSAQDYTQEPTLKLLTADFFGPRYPASDSDIRLSVEGGADVKVPDMGDLEIANGLPEQQLILHAGGRVVYDIPISDSNGKVDTDLIYVTIKPGKKDPPPLMDNPFTDKANITLLASAGNGGTPVEVTCGVPNTDYSSYASEYCILSIEQIVDELTDTLVVTVTVPVEEKRDAVLWQVQLSSLDDSKRIRGTFGDEARARFRQTQEVADFNTWLTLVSCVGKTGVGKSTVASLLSGNDTMFVAHSSSHGTTTIGADVSTVIPALNYKQTIDSALDVQVDEPTGNRPLFLIDSEGMKFRGDEVDFVTTGPVAIIANIIIWITEGRMRPPDILEELRHYLKGLDRISLGEGSSQEKDYGKFVVVLNKMQDSDQNYSDEQLCSNLLAWGQSDEDDATIAELKMRFKSISCIGFPLVHLEENENFGYGVIKRYPRFTKGLTKLSNMLIDESSFPHDVKIGNDVLEMNSTNAETIIGLLIDGANKGTIDLTDPCNVIYSLYKEQVLQEIEKLDAEILEATTGMCDHKEKTCSKCVCEYRNSAVEFTANKLFATVTAGITEADTLCVDKPQVKDEIATLIDEMITPWQDANMCLGVTRSRKSEENCDSSELQATFDAQPNKDLNIVCNVLHMCGTLTLHNSETMLSSKKIYISPGFQLVQNAPEKAADGADNHSESGNGENGKAGLSGKDITLQISDSLLTSSANLLYVNLHGGDGGNGGKGGNGKSAVPGINGKNGVNGNPGNNGHDGKDGLFYHPDHSNDARYCSEVLSWGGQHYGSVHECCREGHCCCFFDASIENGYMGYLATMEPNINTRCAHTHRYWQAVNLLMEFNTPCETANTNGGDGTNGEKGGKGTNGADGTDAIPATKGGNGGLGGAGGSAGSWTLKSNLAIDVVLKKLGGKGGVGGLAGIGGAGAEGGKKGLAGRGGKGGIGGSGGSAGACYKQKREFEARDNWHTSAGCHGFAGCSSNVHTVKDACSNFAVGTVHPEEVYHQGLAGKPGVNGTVGDPGVDGKPGKAAAKAPDGKAGTPGQNGKSVLLHL